MSFPITNNEFSIINAAIDFKVAGPTLLFTPTSDFVLTKIIFYGEDISGTVTGTLLSLGTNGSVYDNIIPGIGSSISTTGQVQIINVTAPLFLQVSALDDIYVNVITPDSGAINSVQRVDISGYYIS